MATLKPSRKEYINIMTDNNKFIPKIPETRTEMVLDQEQQTPQEQKSTVEKAVESVKEAVVPTVYASENLGEHDKEIKKNIEEAGGGAITAIGAKAPAVGAIASGGLAILGGIEGAIGEVTDSEGLKIIGDAHKNTAKKPVENIGRAINKASE